MFKNNKKRDYLISRKRQWLLFVIVFDHQRTFKMATEVFNWVQKYDADLETRQVSDKSKIIFDQ